ncbi:MAG: peptidoglycan-associated lipoprotein [Cellvibrionaceae bacterium]|jgi:peptidoglycan-associated lipoprotein
MLNKTIKWVFSLLFITVFLAGCTTTSTPEVVEPEPQVETVVEVTPPVVVPQPRVEVTPEPIASTFYFDFDQSQLRPATRALLIAHATELKENPTSIRLEGHADERGTREYNMALGERRGLAVRDFLRSEGVTSAIEVVSYGEERPVNAASNEVAWQQNRRVELVK